LRQATRLANTPLMRSLREYRQKRPPGKSPEPRGGRPSKGRNSFVVQRHDATRLHYDFRLELDGVLKSWAVPKGPSLDPGDKRLAVQTEDHPLDYGCFEGTIPEGNYGAGEVMLWDNGTYTVEGNLSAQEQLEKGELKFSLHGQKLNGSFVLVRLKGTGPKKEWLMIKHRDAEARTGYDITEHDVSIKSGKPPGPPRHPKRSKEVPAAAPKPAELTNAVQAPMPEQFALALASPSEKPFSSDDWLYEIKWDGIRVLAIINDGQTNLVARSGRDITNEYPEFRDLAKRIRARQVVLDGEIVVLDPDGRSSFQRIQARFGVQNPPAKLQSESPPTYYCFDVLYCDGYDVRRAPLSERKELLSKLLATNEHVRISEYQVGKGIELFEAAAKNGLEGLIAKRVDASYPSGRTSNWLKFKTVLELDAIIGGWTDPRGSRQHFGSLLVGLYEKKTLRFIGGVGTGFTAAFEKELFARLEEISSNKCPFTPVPETRERAHWVVPKLVARVGYAEWTSDNHLRQPRFIALQSDREARDTTLEKETAAPVPPPPPKQRKPAAANSRRTPNAAVDPNALVEAITNAKQEEVRLEIDGHTVKLTHLNKVYFPKAGYTKRDVLSYYAAVGPHILPFLKDRPLVLHRYPNGISGSAFYQKEAGQGIPDWIRTVKIYSETKHQEVDFFLIDDFASLLYLSNLGCIEHNPFSARADDLEKPDYMFMDLDPTDNTPFSRVVSAAKVLGEALRTARLEYFVKTSGATGLHMFVPIEQKYSFDQVRALLEILTRLAVEKEQGLLTRIFRVQDRPKNTVFVDVRQNAYAQSLASVFSLRPREGAPVSTPLALTELKPELKPEQWNLKTVLADLPRRAKLWSNFFARPQTLEVAIEAIERAQAS
jgi:bifunctional non-homologous end joining protein LigD